MLVDIRATVFLDGYKSDAELLEALKIILEEQEIPQLTIYSIRKV